MPATPNLLVVTFDTTRADHVGAYGAKPSPTPALDRLAARGVLFERAIAPTPLTLPAHATLFTGRSPREHGARTNLPDVLREGETTLAELLAAKGYATGAVVGAAVLDRQSGLAQGFQLYDDRVRVGPRQWFNWKERGASQVAEAAQAQLETLEPPFFLWVHFYDPHLPYVPPEPFATRFEGDPYAGEIAFADEHFASVLASAEKRAGGRGALVVVAAGDHGEALGEKGEKDHGVLLYQGTQRVPLIVAGPGYPEGRVVSDTVGLVDLLPTLAARLGFDRPEDSSGRDLAPLVAGGRDGGAAPLYEMESLHPARAYGWRPLFAGVRGRYVLHLGDDAELFDLVDDPGEETELSAVKEALADALARALSRRFAGDPVFEEGLDELAGFEDMDPERRAALESLGYASGGGARPDEARPDPREAIGWLADLDRARELLRRREDPQDAARQAVALLDPLLKKNPGNQPARLVLGSALLASGELDAAVAVFQEATERNPSDPLTRFNLGRALAARAETRVRAEAAFREVLKLSPRDAEALSALADLLAQGGRGEESLQLLTKAASEGVVDAGLAMRRALLHAQAGQLDAADKALAESLALDPGNALALERRAELAFARGDARSAAEHYASLMELEPSARVARTLGSILWLELTDASGARRAFERALELEPTGPEADNVREILSEIP